MRSCLVIAILVASTTTAVASPSEPANELASEQTAFALSLGGELASLALLTAPIIQDDVLGGGCDIEETIDGERVVVDIREDGVCSRGASDTAMALAVVGAIGTLVAPSLGHWYGSGRVWTRGMKLRIAGLLLATVGSMALSCWDENCPTRPDRFPGALVPATGVALYVVGSVDDIVTVKSRVREHNARLRDVMVTPTPMQGGAGLVMAGRF